MIDWHLVHLVFIVGFVSDILIQILAFRGIMGASLVPYYNSLGAFPPSAVSSKNKVILYGALLGGLACVFAVVVAMALQPFVPMPK
jgi:hypothetical protein